MHFHWRKKRKKEANGAFLNDAISLHLPLDAQMTGEEEDFSPTSSRSFTISLPTCTNLDTAHASLMKIGHGSHILRATEATT